MKRFAPLSLIVAATLLSPPARADDAEKFCASAKQIIAKLDKDEVALRGKRLSSTGKSTMYEGTITPPGARKCSYIEYNDGAKPFYTCALDTKPCNKAEKQFDTMGVDVSLCLDPIKPDLKMEVGKMQAKWVIRGKLQTRLILKTANQCELSFFVEKG